MNPHTCLDGLPRILAPFVALFISLSLTAQELNFERLYGAEHPQSRVEPYASSQSQQFREQIKPILDKRCVVCHACYDAPCQLNLGSPQGIDRGASQQKVYDGTRLTASQPTRLFEDAFSTEGWRALGFYPVLNERSQNTAVNKEASAMMRLLTLKRNHPLPDQAQLTGFDFSLDRNQVCPTNQQMDDYEKKYPLWGMPYGLPSLTAMEYQRLQQWIGQGAKMSAPKPLGKKELQQVKQYETFLNGASLQAQLAARYIFEHLYLSHLYFTSDSPSRHQERQHHIANHGQDTERFFQMVRSATPPGQPVERIVTRRPYDDPKVDRVYYRLVPIESTIVDKTHMPYALTPKKLHDWQKWFLGSSMAIKSLPDYSPDVAANPITAFVHLPVKSRFRFMLDNAQNTIMAYIKGPVCRGQLALNVINDRFWIFFLDPDKSSVPAISEFYAAQASNMNLPSELESNTQPVTHWATFARQQGRYLRAKSDFLNQWFAGGKHLTTDLIWTGDGDNPNAALTIFRHFDSASVVQGLVGTPPKTAWILDYALLERIHYLLVSGFDVYGNFGHQLMTRMFMDFLRLEGESNFIALLPNDIRHKVHASWYQKQSPQLTKFLQGNIAPFSQPTQVMYHTDHPVEELMLKLKSRVSPVLPERYAVKNTPLSDNSERLLKKLHQVGGDALKTVPQIIMVQITSQHGEPAYFTLLHNNAHYNISSLFNEDANRDYAKDSLTIVKGLIGSYPSAYLALDESQVASMVTAFMTMKNEQDYIAILDKFAIRRSDDRFWSFSDRLHDWYQQNHPIEFGLLDYNRFENR